MTAFNLDVSEFLLFLFLFWNELWMIISEQTVLYRNTEPVSLL